MIPPRRLIVLYIAAGHLSLALAFLLTAWDPYAVAGFFYHARMIAIVHLITIGWIAMSILGNLYIVLPMALNVPFPAAKWDYTAYAFVVIGLIGMAAHFWIAEFGGMAWSALTAAAGIAYVMARLASNVHRAKAPGGIKLHLYCASLNILGAISLGVLLAFDKVYHFLPGYVLSNVFAHVHLAAVGWPIMMVLGLGYRLLPMILPTAAPSGRTIYISAVLLETGVLGLVVSLLLRSALVLLFAVCILASFAAFGAHVAWMLRHPKTPPPGRPRGDFAIAHAATAGFWLLAAGICGVILTAAPMTDATLRVALLYGVFGLVGCLAQVIVAFELRILPTAAAYWALEQSGFTSAGTPHVPNELRRLVVYCAWLAGVPALGAGFFFNAPLVLGAAAWLLCAAVLIGAIDVVRILARPRASQTGG